MDLLKKYLLSGVARMAEDGSGAGAGSAEGARAGADAGAGCDGKGQQQQQQEGATKDYVTLADDDEDEIVIGDDEGEDEGEQGEQEGEGRPRRRSGSARLRARLARVERENRELRDAVTHGARRAPAASGDDDLVAPKESDFPNDYLAFEAAMQDYRVRKAIREENQRVAKEQSDADAERATRVKLSAYNDRLETVKDRIPDFDDVMAEARGQQIRDDVLDQILDSAKGPLIAYHLAKNPGKVDALNRMSPLEAAKEIGRLEARIRGPQAKKVTRAEAPLKSPKGGT